MTRHHAMTKKTKKKQKRVKRKKETRTPTKRSAGALMAEREKVIALFRKQGK